MKKLSLLIALTLLASGIMLSPSIISAQDDKQAQLERDTYTACWEKKDEAKCLPLCSELVEKYPGSNYTKNCKAKIDNKKIADLSQKFQNALKAYNDGADSTKLEQLFTAGEDVLKAQPGQQYYIAYMALAGANGALGQFYKNLDKVKGYAETALKAFEPTTPPEGWKPEEWNPLRDLVLAQMNQYLGWRLVETKGDQEQALNYLTKATQVRNKDGLGWKDPNNYLLRSTVYGIQYAETRKPYDAMTDEQKVSDAGKEIIKKVNTLLDTKLIPEYARVLATATKPEAKEIYDGAKREFDNLWKYRTDAPDKAADYIKNYVADPTIASVPIPAKPEDSSNLTAPTVPITGPANVKLSSSGAAIAPGASGKAASNGNGKSAPAKGKGSSKGKRRRG